MLTKQEIFDKVATHLLTQNKQALHMDGGSCMYRAPGGLKCAAGALIEDEHYRPELEFVNCNDYGVSLALRNSGVPLEHHTFVRELQIIHDALKPSQWREALTAKAAAHGLVAEFAL